MAEIRINGGETPEESTRRFETLVRKQGILSAVRNRSSFMSPSQKRRMKSKKAQKRQRKQERLTKRFEAPDNKSQGWELLHQDIAHGWPIDLNAKPSKPLSDRITRSSRFIQESKPAEEPSDYASVIFEYTNPTTGEAGLILVQNEPDKKIEDKPGRFGFPGGSVKPGEALRSGGCREALEETGFEVDTDCYESFHYFEKVDNHTKHCFAGKIIGGTPKKGEEIHEMECRTIESSTELAKMGYLRSFHRKALEAYLEWRKTR